MNFSCYRRYLRRMGFPVVVWLLAGQYLFVASGVPLPLPVRVAKDLSLPFPCMYSKCGCIDAEHCWSSCCCHTLAERLAWARAHGVEPPAALLAAANKPARNASCCAANHTCCESSKSAAEGVPPLSIAARLIDDVLSPTDTDTKQAEANSNAVIAVRALACHGHGLEWLVSIAVTPPPLSRHSQPLDLCGLVGPLQVLGACSLAYPPPVPPPRAGVA